MAVADLPMGHQLVFALAVQFMQSLIALHQLVQFAPITTTRCLPAQQDPIRAVVNEQAAGWSGEVDVLQPRQRSARKG